MGSLPLTPAAPRRCTYGYSSFGRHPVCIQSRSHTGKTLAGSGTCVRIHRYGKSTRPHLKSMGYSGYSGVMGAGCSGITGARSLYRTGPDMFLSTDHQVD